MFKIVEILNISYQSEVTKGSQHFVKTRTKWAKISKNTRKPFGHFSNLI